MRFTIAIGIILTLAIAFLITQNFSGRDDDDNRAYLHDGREFKKNEIDFLLAKFVEKGVTGVITNNGKVSVLKKDIAKCYSIVNSSDFEKLDSAQVSRGSFLPRVFMPPSEQQRLANQEKISKLQEIILASSAIANVEIVYDQVKDNSFRRELIHSAVVTLTSADGHVISRSDASTVRRVVAKSFAGMAEKDVSVVVDFYTYPYFDGAIDTEQEKNLVLNQLDLETTRKKYVSQVQKLVAEFGESQVVVNMELAKKARPVSVSQNELNTRDIVPDAIQATVNGVAKIDSETDRLSRPPSTPNQEIVTVKRLFGIEVSIDSEVVRRYLQRNMGILRAASEEQFSRAVTAIRNEITKKTTGWIRNQGVDFSPDLVSVIVAPEENKEIVEAITEPAVDHTNLLVGVTTAILAVFITAVFFLFKQRIPASSVGRNQSDQFSESGRNFVSRNQATTGSILVDEIQEAVRNDPDVSVQAFQNLVRGDGIV